MGRLIFVTGGTRSGKSRHALALAEACPGPLLYLATATAGDAEMAARIARHQAERGARWRTLEEPLAVTQRLPGEAAGCGAVLLDCVTLWLSNLLAAGTPEPLAALDALVPAVRGGEASVVVVSNEVGSGIVPAHPLARAFRDLSGEANQRLAAAADEAWLVVAGLPLRLK